MTQHRHHSANAQISGIKNAGTVGWLFCFATHRVQNFACAKNHKMHLTFPYHFWTGLNDQNSQIRSWLLVEQENNVGPAQTLCSSQPELWPYELITGTPVTPALWNAHTDFFLQLFLFKLGAHTEATQKQTNRMQSAAC